MQLRQPGGAGVAGGVGPHLDQAGAGREEVGGGEVAEVGFVAQAHVGHHLRRAHLRGPVPVHGRHSRYQPGGRVGFGAQARELRGQHRGPEPGRVAGAERVIDEHGRGAGHGVVGLEARHDAAVFGQPEREAQPVELRLPRRRPAKVGRPGIKLIRPAGVIIVECLCQSKPGEAGASRSQVIRAIAPVIRRSIKKLRQFNQTPCAKASAWANTRPRPARPSSRPDTPGRAAGFAASCHQNRPRS